MELTPAVLVDQKEKINQLLKNIKNIIPRVQIDILDGKFADNKTISIKELQEIKILQSFAVDLHLMVQEPLHLFKEIEKIPVNNLVTQIEPLKDQEEFVNRAIKKKLKPGLAIDLNTPVKKLNKKLFTHLGQVLLMSVKAGFGGQEFNPKVYRKIVFLNKLKKEQNVNFEICVDGGINYKRAKKCFKKGANVVAVGSYFWKQKDYQKIYNKFKNIQ